MNIDREPTLGILLTKGSHIGPAVDRLLVAKGIDRGEGRKNGNLTGEFDGFKLPTTWTKAHSEDVIGEIKKGRYHAGFVGSDFMAEHAASLKYGESPELIELARFDVFDSRTRLSVVAKEEDLERYQDLANFRDKRFIGRHRYLAINYLRPGFPGETEIPVDIDTSLRGGEEAFVRDGKAAAALVVVETGGTLGRERLGELAVIERHIQLVFLADLQAIHERGLVPSLDEFMDKLRNGTKGSRRWHVPPIL